MQRSQQFLRRAVVFELSTPALLNASKRAWVCSAAIFVVPAWYGSHRESRRRRPARAVPTATTDKVMSLVLIEQFRMKPHQKTPELANGRSARGRRASPRQVLSRAVRPFARPAFQGEQLRVQAELCPPGTAGI